jgi:hypothetical protein
MSWRGKWRNQFGSIVEIADDADNRIYGSFTTALEDSGFYGQTVPIVGVHQGDCISFAAAGTTPFVDVVVSYTGLLRDKKMETLWFVAADQSLGATGPGEPAQLKKQNWWRAMTTNMDTFDRVLSAA